MVYRLINGVKRVRVGLARADAYRPRSGKGTRSSKGQGGQGKGGQKETHDEDVVSHGRIWSPVISIQGLNSATPRHLRLGSTLYATACLPGTRVIITPSPRMTTCVLHCKQSPAGAHGQRLHSGRDAGILESLFCRSPAGR